MENIVKWTAEKLSKGKIADYKFPTMVDGEGVRASLYVSGCPFNCLGCYNKKAQNFNWGEDYTPELEEQIMKDLSHDYVDGLSILGGEPFLNTNILNPLVARIKEELPNKTIWVWSGYLWEELAMNMLPSARDKRMLIHYTDVLVDGQFDKSKFNPNLVFRGSWNQRIIDVQTSMLHAHIREPIMLWNNGSYLKGEDHTPVDLFKTRS